MKTKKVSMGVSLMIVNTDASMDQLNAYQQGTANSKSIEGIGDGAVETTEPGGGTSIEFLKNKTIAGVKVGGVYQSQDKAEALAKIVAGKL